MRRGARIGVALGLFGVAGGGCAGLAGIEDLQLTGSPDAAAESSGPTGDATMDTGGGSSGGGDTGAGADTGGEAGPCAAGEVRCAGNAVESCGTGGVWGAATACTGQTCVGGACTGTCAPGQTSPVPCGHCGTDTQTCSASGAWQTSGACAGEGACAPNATQACNTYGSQTCTPACAWGACSCASAAVCTPGATQCSGVDVETCGGCGQWGAPAACTSGTCVAGACSGTCTPGQKQCSGNGVQTCSGTGQWGAPAACTDQTCVGGACTGSCAPGQTNPVGCGKCGTDDQTCSASGAWQPSGTCSGQGVCAPNATQSCNTYGSETCSPSCAWGSCSCGSTPVCTPGAKQCSGTGVQTCTACGQWGNPVSCGAGMTCTGSGTCVVAPTDCPGSYVVCDGFEGSTTINGSTWSYHTQNDANQTIGVDSSQAHRGTNALHVHMNALGNVGYVASFVREIKTTGSTPIYIRAWVLLSQYSGVDNDGLFTLLSDANGQSASGGLGFSTAGYFVDGVENTAGHAYDYSHTSASMLPTGLAAGNWTCVELLVDPSYAAPNTQGLLQVWHGASTTPDPALTGTAELQPLAGVEFGLDFTGPTSGMTNPVDLYFDDIAIDTKYINCSD